MRGPVGTFSEWVDRITLLEGEQPSSSLAARTIFVPRMEIADALRREIVRRGRGSALIGTRFARPVDVAAEILLDLAIRFRPGEDRRRSTRLAALFRRSDLALEYFDAGLLRHAPGWPEAFSETITELEKNGWTPRRLDSACSEGIELSRLRDIASIWSALEESAGSSWSEARILVEATPHAAALRWDAALALLGGDESVVERSFLGAIPGIRLCGLATSRVPPAPGDESELSRLAAGIFDARSTTEPGPGADGSVHLEEHGGLADEVEAAAAWVTRRIAAGDRLDEIALLVPALDPYASLLAIALDALPGNVAVRVSGGMSAIAMPDGAAADIALHALEERLSPRGLVEVLRRLTGRDGIVLSLDRAIALVNALMTDADPSDVQRRWPVRARTVAARIAASGHLRDRPMTGPREEHARADAVRLLDVLTAREALLERLDLVLALSENDASLERIAHEICELLEASLSDGSRSAVIPALRRELDEIAEIPLTGLAALRTVRAALRRIRLPFGAPGMPAVHIGTITDSIGRSFRSLRILGLAEGGFPHVAREDPVFPDALRERLSPDLRRGATLVEDDLRAFADLIRGCAAELRLSTARVNADGSAHEPSPVLLDAAMALHRDGSAIPDLRSLRSEYFSAGAVALREDLARLRALRERRRSPADGDLARGGPAAALRPDVPLAGLDSSRPVAASGLHVLLVCPHRFLLEHVLHWRAPTDMPGTQDVTPMDYGRAFHEHVEAFFVEHGSAFARRDGELAAWQRDARLAVRARESIRPRLERDIAAFLAYDWQRAPSRFIAVERSFGYDSPVCISGVYVHGAIDRIDEDSGTTLVRDLKTGRMRRRSGMGSSPNPHDDLQLAVYAQVARAVAPAWDLPSDVSAAYVHVSAGVLEERAFTEPAAARALLDAGAEWLTIARGLLESRTFPRTPDAHDCARCPFEPACGPGAAAESASRLARARGADGAFLELRSRIARART